MLRTGHVAVSCARHEKALINFEYIKTVTAGGMLVLKHY